MIPFPYTETELTDLPLHVRPRALGRAQATVDLHPFWGRVEDVSSAAACEHASHVCACEDNAGIRGVESQDERV